MDIPPNSHIQKFYAFTWQNSVSHIRLNWAGVPQHSFNTIIKYIEGTETTTRLQVKADLRRGGYETGERIPNEERRAIRIKLPFVCPAWSYTIRPRLEPFPNNHFLLLNP